MQAANFQQRVFRLKVAEDSYQDETRIKVSIRDTEPIDYVEESSVRTAFFVCQNLHPQHVCLHFILRAVGPGVHLCCTTFSWASCRHCRLVLTCWQAAAGHRSIIRY